VTARIARRRWPAISAALLAALHVGAARAQADAPIPMQSVTVTATRLPEAADDVPAALDVVDARDVRDARAQVSIGESLGRVPGLFAKDRQNYAQDVQLSVRGFGARSSFGIRGVRLYVDDIPATLPDGQGQITNVDLGSVRRIEVLRGPFSALYGNSAGGVVSVTSEEGSGPVTVEAGAALGSSGLRRESLKLSGGVGALGLVASTSHFSTGGLRPHSAARRDVGNARLTWHGQRDDVALVVNSVALPMAQDPLGLTRARFDADPRGTDPAALAFDTRKTTDQTQESLRWEHRFDDGLALRAVTYAGHRGTSQFQSIPAATQANPLNPGGVIVLGRDYSGDDVRVTKTLSSLTLVGGLAVDSLREHRQGYENFVGATLGVQGALRRDERNDVDDFDPYAQLSWRPSPRWTLDAGVRRSRVRFASRDAYVTASNPDDSGGATYAATLPVLGVMFKPAAWLHLYANAARGFETPTLNELAYRPSGATGLNFALRPSRSRSFEAGAKAGLGAAGHLDVAVFQSDTDDEIVTQTNVGGRSTYQNGGRTRRTGVELAWNVALADTLQLTTALATLDARYRDGFLTCAATPCAQAGVPIAAGNRLPGTARATAWAALAWRPVQAWEAGVEVRGVSRVMVSDANSDAAPAYATVGAHVTCSASVGAWRLSAFARGDNLAGRRYAGSVIVNEGSGRFFEPAPGRNWVAGGNVAYVF